MTLDFLPIFKKAPDENPSGWATDASCVVKKQSGRQSGLAVGQIPLCTDLPTVFCTDSGDNVMVRSRWPPSELNEVAQNVSEVAPAYCHFYDNFKSAENFHSNVISGVQNDRFFSMPCYNTPTELHHFYPQCIWDINRGQKWRLIARGHLLLGIRSQAMAAAG